MQFKQYLEQQFLAWQAAEGTRRTISEYASFLGVPQTTLSSWMNGDREPGGENLRRLAARLGLEVYDVLGLERPDPDLFYIQQHWHILPSKVQRAIKEQAEAYVDSNEPRKRHVRPVDGTH